MGIVVQIGCLMLFSVWIYFDDFQEANVCSKKLYSCTNCNINSCWDFWSILQGSFEVRIKFFQNLVGGAES